MVVISFKRLVTSLLILILSTALIIFIAMDIKSTGFIDITLSVQNILFWGLIILIIQLFIFISLFKASKKVTNDISKISNIGDLNNPVVKKIINSMGSLGKEIELLIKGQSSLVELRSNRIYSLNTLIKTISIGYSTPIVITDVEGNIFSYSSLIKDKFDKINSENKRSFRHITDIRPDISISKVLSYMEIQKVFWSDKEFKGVICTPVIDKSNKIDFCIWEFESETFQKLKLENTINKPKSDMLGKLKSRFWSKK